MVLTSLGARDRGRFAAALRRGEPVHLSLQGSLPADLHPAEVAPLCASTESPDPQIHGELERWHAPAASGPACARVSVVIPTHRRVPLGLAAWLEQEGDVDVVVAWNGPGPPPPMSGARVVRLPWRGHGQTRQDAILLLDAPLVLLTVDDAIPMGAGFVRRLADTLTTTGGDAVVARQVPWPDAPPVTRERLRAWTPPAPSPQRVAQTDHVATLYRRAALLAHPLPAVPIAEDAWWSQGRKVWMDPGAPVLHSHRRRPLPLYRRDRDIHRQLRLMEEGAVSPARLRALPGRILRAVGAGARWGPGEAINHAAEALGQWRGRRLGAPGGGEGGV